MTSGNHVGSSLQARFVLGDIFEDEIVSRRRCFTKANMFYEANIGGFEDKDVFDQREYEDEKVFGDERFSEAKMFLKMYSKTTMGCRTIDLILCAFF